MYRIRPTLRPTDFHFVFWVLMMLIAINVSLQSERHSGLDEKLFIYTLVSPGILFLSRLLFNTSYLFLVGAMFYTVLLGLFYPQISYSSSFVGLIGMGAFALSCSLSLTSAIASHGSNQNTILSILSIPVLIPVVMSLHNIGITKLMMTTVDAAKYIGLFSISLISLALSMVLFPIVWKQ
ncbi:MAG: hypothetical protein AAFQ02_12970 [Bacteroidota bacterium]